MTAGELIGIGGFAAYFAAVVILQRIVRGNAAFVATASAVVLSVAVPLVALGGGASFNFWEFTAVYSSLTLAFLMVFGAVYKSVSLRMLEFLLAQPGRAAPVALLRERYVASESFAHRLAVIERSGFAARHGETFTLAPRGRAIAKTVKALHAFFAIERIG